MGVDIVARTQKIVVSSVQRIVVEEGSVRVLSPTSGIKILSAGPQGPPGVKGDKGDTGDSSNVVAEAMMIAHINSPEPHPVYDDIPDLTIHFENGLY